MNILVLNCGSSSVKFQLINMADETASAKGLVEEIGHPQAQFNYETITGEHLKENRSIPDHEKALQCVIDTLMHCEHGVLEAKSHIAGIGHRVVHGGAEFTSSVLIDDHVLKVIESLIPLSPLHNPANLMGIKVAGKVLSGIPQVAVFDTAHGAALPAEANTYAVPSPWRRKYNIRRYGFHGTSHAYVAKKAAKILKAPYESIRIITCHLGNGASIAAVKNGKCIETSMGFTPLEGLVMGTRSGDIDPAIIPFIGKHEGYSMQEIDQQLNTKSGMLALTGETDMRIIEDRARAGNDRERLALDVYVHRIKKYIGAYTFIMGGVDVLVFTAGIGENSAYVRERVLCNMDELGITFDADANRAHATHIGTGRVKVLIVPTNEELAIARDTQKVLENNK